MPGKFIGRYVSRSLEVYSCRGVLRPYVPVQLEQGIYVGIRLQLSVVGVRRIPKRSDLVVRELRANKSYQAGV